MRVAYLVFVSFVWALSFGLIKDRLVGLDSNAVAAVRLLLSGLVFAPWLRRRGIAVSEILKWAAIGAVQFGAMYVLYLRAFQYLAAHEIAMFTIFTPLYVILFDAIWLRKLRLRHWFAALCSVLAAAALLWDRLNSGVVIHGFLLMQASNLCFAVGQLAYKRLRSERSAHVTDPQRFAWLYVGAMLVALIGSVGLNSSGDLDLLNAWRGFAPRLDQWLVLVYLGVFASGICFFLWNLGALKVNAGTLAVFNNAKIPLAVICSIVFFHEKADFLRLFVSLTFMAVALWLTEKNDAAENA